MKPKSVKKKLKQPSFAAGVDRDQIQRGDEELGVDVDEHIAVVIDGAGRARATSSASGRGGRQVDAG